jgi:hypothetical protein
MTPFLDIATAPRERLIESIMGRSSGVRPTAKATAKRRDFNTLRVDEKKESIYDKDK